MSTGGLFGLVEQNRSALNIAAYSLGQTSLEQIFLAMASQQEEERGMARGMYLPGGPPAPGAAGGAASQPAAGAPPERGNTYV